MNEIRLGSGVKILTVRQPWASALLRVKDVENRSWQTAHLGWILIHAGKTIAEFVPARHGLGDRQATLALPRGAIIGAIRITSVVRGAQSPWAEPGFWHWCHNPEEAIRLPSPIPWRGVQGLVRAPAELLRQLPHPAAELIR